MSMMSTFLTIVVVMILNTIITTAFICGGLELLHEKILKDIKEKLKVEILEELKKEIGKEETKWENSLL